MKNLNGKNREGRKFDGLKIITYVITATCIFGSGGKQVPVASRRVGVASERVPVASEWCKNRFQCVPNSPKRPVYRVAKGAFLKNFVTKSLRTAQQNRLTAALQTH